MWNTRLSSQAGEHYRPPSGAFVKSQLLSNRIKRTHMSQTIIIDFLKVHGNDRGHNLA